MRFFVDIAVPQDLASLELTGPDAHHLRDVLRARIGETVVVCDAVGTDHRCEISEMSADGVFLKIIERHPADTEPPYQAVLLQGLAKGDRMESLIQKSVELGVANIVPFVAGRSVVRLTPEEGRRKAERWSRVAEEASKQCGRARVPLVEPPISFDEALERASRADLAFLPWEGERRRTLASWFAEDRTQNTLHAATAAGRSPVVAFLIGPEGGFEAGEIDRAISRGLSTVTLGRRILRTETAGPAVLAQLSLLLETGSGGRSGAPDLTVHKNG